MIPIRCLQPQLHVVSGATGQKTFGSARHPLPVVRMNEPTGTKKASGCLQPLFKSKTDVVERNAVGIKTFTTGTKHGNLLRREVHYLPELHFLLPDLFLGPLALDDVDDSAHKFNEIAGRAQNRMSYGVNILDGAIRMHDAVVRLPLCLLADSCLD